MTVDNRIGDNDGSCDGGCTPSSSAIASTSGAATENGIQVPCSRSVSPMSTCDRLLVCSRSGSTNGDTDLCNQEPKGFDVPPTRTVDKEVIFADVCTISIPLVLLIFAFAISFQSGKEGSMENIESWRNAASVVSLHPVKHFRAIRI